MFRANSRPLNHFNDYKSQSDADHKQDEENNRYKIVRCFDYRRVITVEIYH